MGWLLVGPYPLAGTSLQRHSGHSGAGVASRGCSDCSGKFGLFGHTLNHFGLGADRMTMMDQISIGAAVMPRVTFSPRVYGV